MSPDELIASVFFPESVTIWHIIAVIFLLILIAAAIAFVLTFFLNVRIRLQARSADKSALSGTVSLLITFFSKTILSEEIPLTDEKGEASDSLYPEKADGTDLPQTGLSDGTEEFDSDAFIKKYILKEDTAQATENEENESFSGSEDVSGSSAETKEDISGSDAETKEEDSGRVVSETSPTRETSAPSETGKTLPEDLPDISDAGAGTDETSGTGSETDQASEADNISGTDQAAGTGDASGTGESGGSLTEADDDDSDEGMFGFFVDDYEAFILDTVDAVQEICPPVIRLTMSLLRNVTFEKVSLTADFGAEDPYSTSLIYGFSHVAKGSVLAFFDDQAENGSTGKIRKNASVLFREISGNVVMIPHFEGSCRAADGLLIFSVKPCTLYIPSLRFIVSRNVRRFFTGYVYKYFVRHPAYGKKNGRAKRSPSGIPEASSGEKDV